MQGRMVFDALSSLFGDRIMMVRLLTFALKHVRVCREAKS
jgi:hypothetical protein